MKIKEISYLDPLHAMSCQERSLNKYTDMII